MRNHLNWLLMFFSNNFFFSLPYLSISLISHFISSVHSWIENQIWRWKFFRIFGIYCLHSIIIFPFLFIFVRTCAVCVCVCHRWYSVPLGRVHWNERILFACQLVTGKSRSWNCSKRNTLKYSCHTNANNSSFPRKHLYLGWTVSCEHCSVLAVHFVIILYSVFHSSVRG